MTDASVDKPTLAAGDGPFTRHVFVCAAGGVCPTQGAEKVHAALKDAAKQACGSVAVRVNKSGCLGQCGNGPMVCVYPENVWYAGVGSAAPMSPTDVQVIIEKSSV